MGTLRDLGKAVARNVLGEKADYIVPAIKGQLDGYYGLDDEFPREHWNKHFSGMKKGAREAINKRKAELGRPLTPEPDPEDFDHLYMNRRDK